MTEALNTFAGALAGHIKDEAKAFLEEGRITEDQYELLMEATVQVGSQGQLSSPATYY